MMLDHPVKIENKNFEPLPLDPTVYSSDSEQSFQRIEQLFQSKCAVHNANGHLSFNLGLGKHTDQQEEIRRKIDTTGLLEFPFLKEILV